MGNRDLGGGPQGSPEPRRGIFISKATQSRWNTEARGRFLPVCLSENYGHGAGQGGRSVLEGAGEEALAAVRATRPLLLPLSSGILA